MDRRGFFRLIGRTVVLGAAAKVAPGLLVVQSSSGCPQGLPGLTGHEGLRGPTGVQPVPHDWTGCLGTWTGCQDGWHQKYRIDRDGPQPWEHLRPSFDGKLL